MLPAKHAPRGERIGKPTLRVDSKDRPLAVFSGKSYLRVLDILYAGYDVETYSSYSHITEPSDAVGTRRA